MGGEGEGRRGTGWEGEELRCSHLCNTHTQEEYDIVTNDYEKAKSLFAGTQVKVFKKGQNSCQCSLWFLDHLCLFMCVPLIVPSHHTSYPPSHPHTVTPSPLVLEEVENQIRKLREDLRKKLHMLPSTLEEQKKLIK